MKKYIRWMLVHVGIIFVGFCVWAVCASLADNDCGKELLTVVSSLASLIALPLSIYSTYILFIELRNGCTCSKKMIEKGAEKLARDINAFQPTRIIYVDGNSTLLYENYVSKHIKAGCPVIALPNIPKTSLSQFGASKVVSTNKFIINVDSCTFTSDERVVIFDDITKTGETIKELKKYLIDDCKLSPLNILTCGFITDKFGYANSAEPGFYFLRTEVKDGYRFPWRLS